MNRILLAATLALGGMVMIAGARIMALERALAAKPTVEIRTVEKIKTVRVAGPVQVRERTIIETDGRKVTERTTDRGEVTTNTGKESDVARSEAPACAPVTIKSRFIGVLFDPLSVSKINGARAGLTIFGRVDAAASLRVDNHGVPAGGGDLSWRF